MVIRCRDPAIRRRALALLGRATVQEGVWNSDDRRIVVEYWRQGRRWKETLAW